MADNPVVNIRSVLYIKTSVMFCNYYKRRMFFSNVELFWYKFSIGSCKIMAKKCFDKIQANNKMASKMNVATGNAQCLKYVTS